MVKLSVRSHDMQWKVTSALSVVTWSEFRTGHNTQSGHSNGLQV